MHNAQNTTLVVMNAGGSTLEPYSGSRAGNATLVFTRHPEESAFHLDIRLRANMARFADERVSPSQAVLVWNGDETEREILRRTQLIARYLPAGATLSLATESADSFQLASLEGLAVALRKHLVGTHITVSVFCHSPQAAACLITEPPMTAAWRMIQKRRVSNSSRPPRPHSEVVTVNASYKAAM